MLYVHLVLLLLCALPIFVGVLADEAPVAESQSISSEIKYGEYIEILEEVVEEGPVVEEIIVEEAVLVSMEDAEPNDIDEEPELKSDEVSESVLEESGPVEKETHLILETIPEEPEPADEESEHTLETIIEEPEPAEAAVVEPEPAEPIAEEPEPVEEPVAQPEPEIEPEQIVQSVESEEAEPVAELKPESVPEAEPAKKVEEPDSSKPLGYSELSLEGYLKLVKLASFNDIKSYILSLVQTAKQKIIQINK